MAKTPLVDLELLTALVRRPPGSLDDDLYTRFWVESADATVRDAAGQPHWVGALSTDGDVDPNEVVAPERARQIATIVAMRAWTDKGNLERRTAGPISDTYRDGLKPLELTDAERNWLGKQDPNGSSDGPWVQPIGSGRRAQPVYLADGAYGADPVLMDDGSWTMPYTPVGEEEP